MFGVVAVTLGIVVPLDALDQDFAIEDMIPPAYADFAAPIFAAFASPALTTKESDVAEAVFLAATDGRDLLRYPAGPDAVALVA